MSLLFSHEDCSLISHEIYSNKICTSSHNDGSGPKYKIRSDLFDLNVRYRQQATGNHESRIKKRHRKIIDKNADRVINEYPDEYALITKLKEKTEEFMKICLEKEFLSNHHTNNQTIPTNERLKRFLDEWQSIEYPPLNSFNGGNDSAEMTVFRTNNQSYLIPQKCRFFNIDVKQLEAYENFSKTFDVITLDPPWWNKYVRRSRKTQRENGYEMLTNDDIAKIPVEKWITVDRTLVAIWCTNAPSMIRAVREQLLVKWRLKLLARWFWIKITKYGETICEFDLPLKKQPFEQIFIACHIESMHDFKVPDEKLIFSVPSAIHSHKPPLQDLLRPYLIGVDEENFSLELFARYLLPNCTSIGAEVLKLQNLQLFSKDVS